MNVFLTIVIAGMLGTGAIPNNPGEGTSALSNIPPQSLLYSVESQDNSNNLIDSQIWQQITDDMDRMPGSDNMGVYLVSGNDLEHATRLAQIPTRDHSYSMNVPPSSQILYVGKKVQDGKTTYTVNGVVNKHQDWVYISAVMRSGAVSLLTQDEGKAFTSIQMK